MTPPRGFYRPPPNDDELRVAAIDLDGTLAVSTWHPEQAKSVIGDPIEHGVDQLIRLYLAGYEIVIHTSRPWADRRMIKAWLHEHEIPYDSIVCGKLLASVYVDDKAINAQATHWNVAGVLTSVWP